MMWRNALPAAALLALGSMTMPQEPARVPGIELAADDRRQIDGIFERWQNA